MVPCMVHIAAQPAHIRDTNHPIALVLTPTRELAIQISDASQLISCTDSGQQIRIGCVVGGADRDAQREGLRSGCDCLIATPGRLLDLLSTKDASLQSVSFIVLDEADRMLDFGFAPALTQIFSALPESRRQILLFTATWQAPLVELSSKWLSNPVQIRVGATQLVANQKAIVMSSSY